MKTLLSKQWNRFIKLSSMLRHAQNTTFYILKLVLHWVFVFYFDFCVWVCFVCVFFTKRVYGLSRSSHKHWWKFNNDVQSRPILFSPDVVKWNTAVAYICQFLNCKQCKRKTVLTAK